MDDHNTRHMESSDSYEARLNRARNGDRDALGNLLDEFRDPLRDAVERELRPRLKARIDPSSVVQQTLLSACRNFAAFDGQRPEDLHGWLKRIQDRNLLDLVRKHLGIALRSVGREELPLGDSAAEGRALPERKVESASVLAATNETAQRLRQAIDQLPDDQRVAVRMRHLEGRSLAEIVEHLGRTRDSVAALIKRGLARLRLEMSVDD